MKIISKTKNPPLCVAIKVKTPSGERLYIRNMISGVFYMAGFSDKRVSEHDSILCETILEKYYEGDTIELVF